MKKFENGNLSGVKAFLVAGAFAQMLAGCSSWEYPLSAVPPKPPSVSMPVSGDMPPSAEMCGSTTPRCKEFEQAMVLVEVFRDEYWNGYSRSQNSTYFFDVPLLGFALATVAAATFGAHTDLIAGLALGAAGVGASRNYINPNEVASALLYGARTSSCVLTAMRPLRDLKDANAMTSPNENFIRERDALQAMLSAHQEVLKNAQAELVSKPDNKTLSQAIAKLENAIKIAGDAMETASVEQRVFAQRFAVLDTAVWKISTTVANRLSSGRSIGFGTAISAIREALVQAATKEIIEGKSGEAGITGRESNRDRSLERQVVVAANKLIGRVRALLKATPNYSGAIANAAVCTEA